MQIVASTSLPWVLAPAAPHCAVSVPTGMTTGPGPCPHPVTSFLLVRYPAGRRGVWCAFLCAAHAREVPLAEPLDAVASAELTKRREQHALAMAGRPHRPTEPLQLGVATAGAGVAGQADTAGGRVAGQAGAGQTGQPATLGTGQAGQVATVRAGQVVSA